VRDNSSEITLATWSDLAQILDARVNFYRAP